jgi:hypothetical protein
VALTDPSIWLAGLCEIVLPGRTIRWCDGAFVVWGGNTYTSEDSVFGTIDTIDQITEAISDEAPAGKLTVFPPDLVGSNALFQPTAQGSPMTFWLAEINPATGQVVGTPEKQFSGFLDNIKLNVGRAKRTVEIEFMSQAERLFWIKEGNVLSSRFHKVVWPGELGLDFATGMQLAVPWGVAGPGRGSLNVNSGAFGNFLGGKQGSTRLGGPLVHSS